MGASEGRASETVSLPVVWSRAANEEFRAAEKWYAEIGTDLAERFVEAVVVIDPAN